MQFIIKEKFSSILFSSFKFLVSSSSRGYKLNSFSFLFSLFFSHWKVRRGCNGLNFNRYSFIAGEYLANSGDYSAHSFLAGECSTYFFLAEQYSPLSFLTGEYSAYPFKDGEYPASSFSWRIFSLSHPSRRIFGHLVSSWRIFILFHPSQRKPLLSFLVGNFASYRRVFS